MRRGSFLTSILIMDSLSEKEDTGDTDISGEYEDDFERDLDWLIDEEKENFKEPEDDEEIEACIDKELAEFDDKQSSIEDVPLDFDESPEKPQTKNYTVPVPDMVSDTDSDGSINEIKLENPQELEDQQDLEDEEVKRYIMEKILKANKQLEDEEPIHEGRERKLKFKDNLVDLEVPPAEFYEADKSFINNEDNILDSMSQLQISDEPKQEHKEGKVLVERDGKFELVSLHDIESQGFLPSINITSSENGPQLISPRSSQSSVLSTLANNKKEDISEQQSKNTLNLSVEVVMHVPQPPANPRFRPSSVTSVTRNVGTYQPPRRVQSASYPPKSTTYWLTTKQKELQRKNEQRKEQKKKEEEECKRQEEEQKKKENHMAFRAWLQKKKEQLLEQKRIQQAKELEEMNNSYMERDPKAAFKMWLKKKQEEQLKEKEMDELRKQQHNTYFMHKKEDCDRAFRQWLARKKMEKRAEQLIAKERARRFMTEARRARQIQNLLYNISDTKSFRFTDNYT